MPWIRVKMKNGIVKLWYRIKRIISDEINLEFDYLNDSGEWLTELIKKSEIDYYEVLDL